jgi:5'-deoxynucleotidase YfbR-like HD superfamily hydrolase
MGRNQDLRRKIAGRHKVIEEHEEKIRHERVKLVPDESLIDHWQREIDARKSEIARLNRRLKRAW